MTDQDPKIRPHPSLNPQISNAGDSQAFKPSKGVIHGLKHLDTFGAPPRLTWDQKSEYQTKVGACFSVIFYMIFGICFHFFFGRFILCQDPVIYQKQAWRSITKDDVNLKKNMIDLPLFIFEYYSYPEHSTMIKEYITPEVFDCHFLMTARKHKYSYYSHKFFISEEIQMKRNCTMAKRQKLIDHLSPTGESADISDLESYICFDVPEPKIWGEISECADCQWYSLSLQLKPVVDLAKCVTTMGNFFYFKKLRLYKCYGENALFECYSEHNQF
jgi:hypothetical protein